MIVVARASSMNIVIARNYQSTYGKQLGVAFMTVLLKKLRDIIDDEIIIISCDDLTYRRSSALEESEGTVVCRIPSVLNLSSSAIRNELLWLDGNVGSMTREILQKNVDFLKVAEKVTAMSRQVRVIHWFDLFTPLTGLFGAFPPLCRARNYASLFGLRRSSWCYNAMLGIFARGLEKLVVNTTALEDYVSRHAPLACERVERIPVGVDLSHWKPPRDKDKAKETAGIARDRKVVSWFGPISPSGADDFYRLMSSVRCMKQVAPSLLFLFAFKYGIPPGVPPEESNTKFYGNLGDISEILRVSDMIVLPFSQKNSWVSYQPLTMIQALASGVPVITMNYPGLNEAVISGFSGILVEESRDVAAAALDLCRDENKLRDMSKNAREFAESHFDMDTVAAAYADLWEQ